MPRRETACDAGRQCPTLARLRAVRRRRRRQGDEHHHGLRAHARQPAEGHGAGPAHRAHRGRRGAHLRHGQPVQAGRHLFERGPALCAGGHRLGAVVPRGDRRPDPGGRHQRGRRHRELDGRGHQLQRARPGDAALLHLLLDVRLPARGRRDLGRGRPARRAASCSAPPRAAPRWAARACSTRTAPATWSRRPFPTARPTTRPSRARWR